MLSRGLQDNFDPFKASSPSQQRARPYPYSHPPSLHHWTLYQQWIRCSQEHRRRRCSGCWRLTRGNTVDHRLICRRLGGVVVTSPTPSVKALLTGGGSVLGRVHEGTVGKGTSKTSGPGGNRVVESERAHTIEQHFVGFIILVRKLVLFRSSVEILALWYEELTVDVLAAKLHG